MAAVEVVRKPPVVQPVEEVVLRLTDEEAAGLTALLGATQADPPFHSVYRVLMSTGVYGYEADPERHARLQRQAGL